MVSEQRGTYLGESAVDAEKGYTDCERRQLRAPTPLNPRQPVDEQVPALRPEQVRVSLVVVPVRATVDVQGTRVRRRGGLIDLVGKEGDEWSIRVSLGSMSRTKKVVLQKGTLSPSKIDLLEEVRAEQRKQQGTPPRFDPEE